MLNVFSDKGSSLKSLLIIPSVGYWRIADEIYFDKKFYEGLCLYASRWASELVVLIRESFLPPPSFGLVKYEAEKESILFRFLEHGEVIGSKHLDGASVILASGDDFRQYQVSTLSKHFAKCIYTLEYTLATRIKIAWLDKVNVFKKIKTTLWLINQEIQLVQALKQSYGIQANGWPAFHAYKKYVKDSVVYFDTRNSADMLIDESNLEKRLHSLTIQNPLRLAFSGRLITMKGADDLIKVAQCLKANGVPFRFDIFGNGELEETIRKDIIAHDLSKFVTAHGAVDYENVLVPYIQNNVDIFICCHKQGDPSCTYLETYACGVPILGYANEAHAMILNNVDVGWKVPVGDVNALVDELIRLNHARKEVIKKSKQALNFASLNTFQDVFEKRIDQCLRALD